MNALFAFWLEGVPPHALVLAMLLSYTLCFAGLTFAYLSYRRRTRERDDKEQQP